MTHIEPEHHVSLNVTTTDNQLLDALVADLPADGDDEVGQEYDGPNRDSDEPYLADEEEQLRARIVLQTTYDSNGDVHRYAETHATNLYEALSAHDFGSADYEVSHYLSPTGGVTSSDVADYYEKNPDEQPVDEDGEAYVPSSWDPTSHIVSEVSSE